MSARNTKTHTIGQGLLCWINLIEKLAHKDCMLLQLAKDLEGNDILYDSHGNTKWGQVLDMWHLDL